MDQPVRTEEERDWYILSRFEEYRGEIQANRIRLLGIILFYAVELLNFHGFSFGEWFWPKKDGITENFHNGVTAACVAWTMTAAVVQVALSNQYFPSWLKYFSTAMDIVLLTTVLCLGDGARSPLVSAYFVILGLAAMRLHEGLCLGATIGVALGYLTVLAHDRWYAPPGAMAPLPRYQQAIWLISLILCGAALRRTAKRFREVFQNLRTLQNQN